MPEVLVSHTGVMVDLDLVFGLVTSQVMLCKGHPGVTGALVKSQLPGPDYFSLCLA